MVASLRGRSRWPGPPSPDGGFIERRAPSRFPPSPDGGFIEGTLVPASSDGRPRFHHLQMVASLRARSAGRQCRRSPFPPSPDGGFIEGRDIPRSDAARIMFPPSPDGGFIEGPPPLAAAPYALGFPPSPDGGFIEGRDLVRGRGDCHRRPGFHHLQMVASLRAGRWLAASSGARRRQCFHHLQMVASLRAA
jgi:hypothetical protein